MKIFSKILSLALVSALFLPLASVSAKEWSDLYNEWTYTVTYDFNGGATFDGKGTLERSGLASVAPALNEAYLLSCVDFVRIDEDNIECHPADVKKGKELAYVTVNGERHNLEEGDGYMLNDDTTIVYYWNDLELESYTAEDENGNDISITFDEEDDHNFHFSANYYSFSMTDEELAAANIPREVYEAGKAAVTGAVEDYGEVIYFYEFEVYDENNRPITEGPFEIKIKYTDDMAGYDIYKLVYVDINDDGEAVEVGEPIVLTLKDGYLVGTVPHFSGYALVGADEEETIKAPNTGTFPKNVETSTLLPLFSSVVLLSGFAVLFAFKRAK